MEHFSVLMSVYIREQAALLDRALQSILVNQSVKPSELVLVEDGPLTDGLYHVIDKYRQIFPELISVKLPQNGGLGNALNAGMKQCRYESAMTYPYRPDSRNNSNTWKRTRTPTFWDALSVNSKTTNTR